jgi:multimeric flavodoxin WrbA
MNEQVKVLGVCGSPRARYKDKAEAIKIITKTKDYQELYGLIYDLGSQKRISNSEALMWMALFGAAMEGAHIDFVLLKELFEDPHKDNPEGLRALTKKVEECDGIVLSSPVYFGDCSSYVDLFFTSQHLQDKVVGVSSVGAKRNGGQETTNIYALMEVILSGGIVVGNGPPVSQYGGTGWAGDVGAILDDNYGLDTSLGTGKRVVEICAQSRLAQAYPATVTLISVRSSDRLQRMVEEIQKAFLDIRQLQVRLLWIDQHKISPCLACSRCPREPLGSGGYGCIIEDDMMELDQRLLESDLLAFVFDETPGRKVFWPHFKVFTERTRHLRRNHFALSDRHIGFFQVGDLHRESLAAIKTASYALRQNAVISGPPFTRLYTNEGGVIENTSLSQLCLKMANRAWRRKFAVTKNQVNNYTYHPVGYEVRPENGKGKA